MKTPARRPLSRVTYADAKRLRAREPESRATRVLLSDHPEASDLRQRRAALGLGLQRETHEALGGQ